RLANHCQSFVVDSPKDKLIYQEIQEKWNITPFEKTILENDAFLPDYTPNDCNIFNVPTDPEILIKREKFLQETGLNPEDLEWDMNALIKLHNYKKDPEKIKRLEKISEYYHKQHFLMSLGLRKTPK
ncbi:MAG: hypothetical protein ACOC3V_04730, partial [bacterium]